MQREPRNDLSRAVLHLPDAFAHPVGSHVIVDYQAMRGNPALSRWAFYGSIPAGVMGVGLTGWGISQATKSCPDELGGCFPDSKSLLISGGFMLAIAGAATWWYYWSRDEKFTTYEDLSAPRPAMWSSGPLR